MRIGYILPLFLTICVLLAGCVSLSETPGIDATPTLIPYRPNPTRTATAAPSLPATVVPREPSATPFVHIVQQGETLLAIAIRYGVTLDELLLVNPEVDPRILSVGYNLAIPGPGGEPIDQLLPTPTAVPLRLGDVRCYPTTKETMKCLLEVTNILAAAVEGVSASVSLFDSDGVLLDQVNTNTLTRFLAPNHSSVLDATFRVATYQNLSAKATLLSAVQVLNPEGRQLPADLVLTDSNPSPDRRAYQFEGTVDVDTEIGNGEVLITVQALGYNRLSQPIASNAVQFVQAHSELSRIPISLSLYSLSGEIETFDFLVEALLVVPPS